MRVYVVEPGRASQMALGASIVADAMRRDGHRVTHIEVGDNGGQLSMWGRGRVVVSELADLPPPDAWAVSGLYVRQMLYLGKLIRSMGLETYRDDRRPADPPIILGGSVAAAPAPYEDLVDLVCVGDGEITSRGALLGSGPGVYRPGVDSSVTAAWGATIDGRLYQTGHRGMATVEAARGCRGRCRFCSIGWRGGPYREATLESVADAVFGLSSCNIFAPDGARLSYSTELRDRLSDIGVSHTGVDASVRSVARGHGLGGRGVAMGIEGVSARLRKAVGKPLSEETILRAVQTCVEGGVSRIKLYLVPGLPGETAADRSEFTALLAELESLAGTALSVTPSLFTAVPHTPLELEDGRWPEDAYEWVRELRAERSGMDGKALVLEPRGRELHEFAQWAQRASQRDSAVFATGPGIHSGRWRNVANDVDGPLIGGNRYNWSHVDMGARGLSAQRLRYYEILDKS